MRFYEGFCTLVKWDIGRSIASRTFIVCNVDMLVPAGTNDKIYMNGIR